MKKLVLVLALVCQPLAAFPQQLPPPSAAPIQNAEPDPAPASAEENPGGGGPTGLTIGLSVLAGVAILLGSTITVVCGGESCDLPAPATTGTR